MKNQGCRLKMWVLHFPLFSCWFWGLVCSLFCPGLFFLCLGKMRSLRCREGREYFFRDLLFRLLHKCSLVISCVLISSENLPITNIGLNYKITKLKLDMRFSINGYTKSLIMKLWGGETAIFCRMLMQVILRKSLHEHIVCLIT